MAKGPRVINLIRLGNPWMVGQHVSRIVPVHAIQGFLATVFKSSKELPDVRNLARGTPEIDRFACFNGWHPRLDQQRVLQECIFAIFSPDRRVFRTKKGPAEGSVTPLVAGLATPTASDDGLGKRMAELLGAAGDAGWAVRLDRLLAPGKAHDPATATAMALLGGDASAGTKEHEDEAGSLRVSKLEASVAEFVASLINDIEDARRLRVIQDLGRGLYFGAIWLLTALPLADKEQRTSQRIEPRLVFVYAGMPPRRLSMILRHRPGAFSVAPR